MRPTFGITALVGMWRPAQNVWFNRGARP